MRRWLCCSCQVEESYPSHDDELLKSPKNHNDGKFYSILFACYKLEVFFLNSSCIYNPIVINLFWNTEYEFQVPLKL